MMRKIRNYLLAGLVVLLPVWLSIFTVVWVFENVDKFMGEPLSRYLNVPLPGVGVILALLVTLLAGWLTTHLLGRQLIQAGERAMMRIPVVRALYSGVKQVTEAVFSPKEQAFSKVVLIEFPRAGVYCLGFVAGELPGTDLIRVWVPPGPSPTAGPVLIYPLDAVVALPMSVEDGLKLIVSGGVLTPRESDIAALARAAQLLQARRARGASPGGVSPD
ncbi:MAG TPA: DUF502 domain-containing protein [Symbiobacteriaceae bacterium]|jgi:uncharacterized membrane protein